MVEYISLTFNIPAQFIRLLDAVGSGAARLVVVAAPVLPLVVGAAVEDREAAGAPRRRVHAADGALSGEWHQIVVHLDKSKGLYQRSLAVPKLHLLHGVAMGAYSAMSAILSDSVASSPCLPTLSALASRGPGRPTKRPSISRGIWSSGSVSYLSYDITRFKLP